MNTVANTVPSGSEGEGGLSRDEVFTMLSNRRRRWVLYYLKRHEGNRVDLRTLVDTISAWEYGTSVEALSWKQRKRVYTALRQSHLPKLDDAGIVKYDQSRGTVELTDSAHEVQLYLEYVPAHDIPWSQYYLGLTLVGTALVVLAWGPIYPFDGLSGLVLASMVLVMFGISALVHHYHLRQHKLGARDVPPEISNA